MRARKSRIVASVILGVLGIIFNALEKQMTVAGLADTLHLAATPTSWIVWSLPYIAGLWVVVEFWLVARAAEKRLAEKVGTARDRLHAIEIEGYSLSNTWEEGHAVSPERWQLCAQQWYERVCDLLEREFSPAEAAGFRALAVTTDPRHDTTGSTQREEIMRLRLKHISDVLHGTGH